MNSERCPRCKRKFPSECIIPCFIHGRHVAICALCALADMREITGDPDGEFCGEASSFALEQCRELYPEANQ